MVARRDVPTWGIRTIDGSNLNMDFLRHLARPFVVAAPPAVTAERGDGLQRSLRIEMSPRHADLPVIASWPALTTPPPVVSGTCVQTSTWDPGHARLELSLQSDVGCTIQLTASR